MVPLFSGNPHVGFDDRHGKSEWIVPTDAMGIYMSDFEMRDCAKTGAPCESPYHEGNRDPQKAPNPIT